MFALFIDNYYLDVNINRHVFQHFPKKSCVGKIVI